MQAPLNSMTVPQLKELAKSASIPKFGGMNKAELIAALEKPIQSASGVCPVTDAPCEKDCAKDECHATVSQDVALKESSPKKSDLENHPKFAKFKTGGKPL